jgi:hypothetical protein
MRTQMGLGLEDRKLKTEKYIDTIFKTSNYNYNPSLLSGSVLDRVLGDSGKVSFSAYHCCCCLVWKTLITQLLIQRVFIVSTKSFIVASKAGLVLQ